MDYRQDLLEKSMRELCDELDCMLEDRYGDVLPRHPNRPERGKAASPAYDGLFSTRTAFTLGYGSRYGRGYVVEIELRSLSRVPEDLKEKILSDSFSFASSLLPKYFPERKLELVRDGNVFKIIGDFSLGTV